MGYCEGLGQMTAVQALRARPTRTARQRRRGARRRAKRATVMQQSAMGRRQWAALVEKVRRGTATSRERRLVGALVPTEVTARAIEKKGGFDPKLAEQMRLARRQAVAAAEGQAEARAAALAEGQAAADAAATAREQRALDAASRREQSAADAEAERVLRSKSREEAAALAAEERQLSIEQAEYEREMFEAAVITNGAPPRTVFVGGGGGGLPSWRDAPVNGAGPAPAGFDAGKLLPIAAGAALLFLGS